MAIKYFKVTNRSDGTAGYELPELNVRRVFSLNESKDIPEKELKALSQTDGGAELIKHYLMVEDKDWVKENLPNAPIEYFWGINEIKKCMLEDDAELFAETLEYAPRGIVDLIKFLSWKMPLTDLNKVNIIQEKLGFNVQAAIAIMSNTSQAKPTAAKERKRRREE